MSLPRRRFEHNNNLRDDENESVKNLPDDEEVSIKNGPDDEEESSRIILSRHLGPDATFIYLCCQKFVSKVGPTLTKYPST